jgi:hypothetical protein
MNVSFVLPDELGNLRAVVAESTSPHDPAADRLYIAGLHLEIASAQLVDPGVEPDEIRASTQSALRSIIAALDMLSSSAPLAKDAFTQLIADARAKGVPAK